MKQIHDFFRYLRQTDDFAVWGTVAFFLLSIFVPSVKIFFVVTFLYFSFLTLIYSFTKAIVYSVIPMTFVSVGQTHPILVVPAKAIVNQLYWEGKHIAISVSPSLLIWSVAILFYPVMLLWNKSKIKLLKVDVFLLIFLLCGVLSALYGSLMSEVSLIRVWGKFVATAWAFYLVLLFSSMKKMELRRIIRTIFVITISLVFFESVFVFRQMTLKAPVGVIVEQAKNVPSFGLGADEDAGSFRPFGFHAHPNGLANDHLLLISAVTLLIFFIRTQFKDLQRMDLILWIVSCLLSLIVIAISLSRAAYVAILLVLVFVFLRHKKAFIHAQAEIKKYLKNLSAKIKLLLILFSFGIVFIVSNRLFSTIYSFTDTGGVNTRYDQYREAVQVFLRSPIWGVGDDMFIPTSYQLFPQGVMTYFPENVHNGFLLLLLERGVVGGVAYAIFLILLLLQVKNVNMPKEIKTVIYSGVLVSFTMMLFHPEYNFFSIFILLVLAFIHIPYGKSFEN